MRTPLVKPPDPLQLTDLNAAIRTAPSDARLRYLRGAVLAGLGRDEDAKSDFLFVLAQDPTHFEALNDLATLLHRTDFRTAARSAYAQAVLHHPDQIIGRINLANALLANGELKDARLHYEAALKLSATHPDAHQGMANLLQQLGAWEAAELHRQQSYRGRAIVHAPFRGAGTPRRVLLLVSAVGGNVPTRFILDDAIFEVATLVVEAFEPKTGLPAHDVIFNAIGDADIGQTALAAAEAVLARSKAPVINPPAMVRRTGRADNANRLGTLPFVAAPKVVSAPRAEIAAVARAFDYPLLLRSPGYHTGQHFRKVDHETALSAAIQALPGEALLVIQYLDARDSEGRARKYRVMMINGALFPLHLAISQDWKVHYFTADMAADAQHRDEEKIFLDDMADVLGPKAMSALGSISAALQLDYAGIDFGLSAKGDLLLFEANATMVVNPPGPDAIWDYRRGAVQAILNAAQTLVLSPSHDSPTHDA